MEKSNTTHVVKSMNLKLIDQYIRQRGPVSRQDIAYDLHMSLPTITQNLKYLEENNLLLTAKEVNGAGGRNAVLYQSNPLGRSAVGIYLTGHHINIAVVDLTGKVIYSNLVERTFNLDSEDYLKDLGHLTTQAIEHCKLNPDEFLGVGIAVQSLISDNGETVVYGFTHNFTGKTRADIAKYIPYTTYLFHDSYVAGFAEVWSRSSTDHAIYISLNESVGGSIILNNQIYQGSNHRAGEIGHMKFNPANRKVCSCGKCGCFDTECNTMILQSYAHNSLEEFFCLLEKHDEGAAHLWDEYLTSLARAVHNLHMLFDSPVIIGGAIGAYIEPYMYDLHIRIASYDPFAEDPAGYCIACQYKTEATAAGAAICLIDRFLSNVGDRD